MTKRGRRYLQPSVEAIKQSFTCPKCGGLFGCDEKGNLHIFSMMAYTNHVSTCQGKE